MVYTSLLAPLYGSVENLHEARINIDDPFDGEILCPVCGNNGIHIVGVAQNTNVSTGNQGNATVTLSCECGHAFVVLFDGHKGNVSARTVILK